PAAMADPAHCRLDRSGIWSGGKGSLSPRLEFWRDPIGFNESPHRVDRGARKRQHRFSSLVSREEKMQRVSILLAAGACAAALLTPPAQAADLSLTRLDCGTPAAPTIVNQRFSDTYALGELKIQLVFSCYLIKHDNEYLLWDTGHALTTP